MDSNLLRSKFESNSSLFFNVLHSLAHSFRTIGLRDTLCPLILQKSKPPKSSTFVAYPTSATLPPYSFMNIDITFNPTGEREFLMQFPVNIKYSDQVFLQVKGEGIMMKLFFDPPEINFDSIQPFADKTIATVDLVNKSLLNAKTKTPPNFLQPINKAIHGHEKSIRRNAYDNFFKPNRSHYFEILSSYHCSWSSKKWKNNGL